MASVKYPAFDTLSLHADAQPDPATGARATPNYQTASFVFTDSDHAASLFKIERTGHVYSRLTNPTNAVWPTSAPSRFAPRRLPRPSDDSARSIC